MKKVININTHKLFTDITDTVDAMARDWAKSGLVHIYSAHTTSCVRVLENEILSFVDIRFWLDKYTPKDKPENRFSIMGAKMLAAADDIAQFWDRDANPDMAGASMEGFQEFMVKPDREDKIRARLEKERARIHGAL
jgi:hypothetical protein